jgi:hypothetical protein
MHANVFMLHKKNIANSQTHVHNHHRGALVCAAEEMKK